jgi:hypothetical protein
VFACECLLPDYDYVSFLRGARTAEDDVWGEQRYSGGKSTAIVTERFDYYY